MKRKIALLLTGLLILGLLAGCSASQAMPALQPWPEETHDSMEPTETADPVPTETDQTPGPTERDPGSTSETEDPLSETGDPVSETTDPGSGEDIVAGDLTFTEDLAALEDRDDVRYLLVYNPDTTTDLLCRDGDVWNLPKRSTGDISTQIDVDMNRADPLPVEVNLQSASQAELSSFSLAAQAATGSYSGSRAPEYRVGDTHEFYTFDDSMTTRALATYTCLYAGTHCNIWLHQNASLSNELAQEYGKRFDEEIYDTDTRLFGQGRFMDNGGKLNLLFYDIARFGGYFIGLDGYSAEDGLSQEQITGMGMNLDHAIVFVNAKSASDPANKDYTISTMAHEFQHQICYSAYLEGYFKYHYENGVDAWYNEALSGFVEEYLYPGIQEKDGRYYALHTSETLRTGQSLYNFDISQGIGAYGSVYLFGSYLANLAGEGVFLRVYDYWRNSGSASTSTADALYHGVGEDVRSYIDRKYPYELKGSSLTESERWMSKLILDYYVTQFHFDSEDPETFRPIEADKLLFNSLYPNKLDVEGGGRAVFAVKDGSYTVPADAAPGMIYVGLDQDFLPVGVVIVP